jgi:hypothetical protein
MNQLERRRRCPTRGNGLSNLFKTTAKISHGRFGVDR